MSDPSDLDAAPPAGAPDAPGDAPGDASPASDAIASSDDEAGADATAEPDEGERDEADEGERDEPDPESAAEASSDESRPEPEPEPEDDARETPEPDPDATPEPDPASAAPDLEQPVRARPAPREAPTYYAAGFWHRLVAACVDLLVIVPVSLLLYLLVGRVAGISLPPSRHYGIDFWLDSMLASDPALIALVGLLVAIATIYALVFQLTLTHTPGMRVMKLRIIDQYGTPLSTARALVRTAGYLASLATLGLGFLWIGFDSEKRGLQDWLSGTYVVKA